MSALRALGIVGYDGVEPALVAALATESPLLLVSEHGAAKTLLLVRLAEALGLTLRHYNASLLEFDDLAGFPIPDEGTSGLRYAAPPGAVWDAEAVFFDEIGRCRPESANKLFPIIHERRLQGVALERLRHRWAATNPPPEASEDGHGDAIRYEGVEPLDPALADRFPFVVPLPRFSDLAEADRKAIVSGVGDRPAAGAAQQLREVVSATRAVLPGVRAGLERAATEYVLALLPRLNAAGLATGGRRAAMLQRNVLAVRAACLALGLDGVERACALALFASIPDMVRRPVSRSVLQAAHDVAWRDTGLPESDPRRVLLAVRDPLERGLLAVTLPQLDAALRGEVLCGALSELPRPVASTVAWQLLPRLVGDPDVPATATETVAELVGQVATGGIVVRGFGTQRQWAVELRQSLAAAPRLSAEELEFLHGVLVRDHQLPLAGTGFAPGDAAAERVRGLLAVRERCLAVLGAAPGGAA